MLSHKIHANGADVNVLSWNKLVGNLWQLVETMVFCLRDLHFSGEDIKPWRGLLHTRRRLLRLNGIPRSMLAVTDDHGAYIYDLSVEGGRYGVRWTFHPSYCLFIAEARAV
jgi:ribosome assembly protein RRB1